MFENQTSYNMPAMQAMVRVTARKVQRRRCLARQAFLVVMGGLALACGLLLAGVFHQLDFSSRLICIAALVIGGVALLEGLCLHWLMARNARKGLLRVGAAMDRHTVFGEASFQDCQPGAETAYHYSAVRAAYETEGYFYLLLDTGRSVILDRKGFTKGDAEGFRTFLEGKLGGPLEFVK